MSKSTPAFLGLLVCLGSLPACSSGQWREADTRLEAVTAQVRRAGFQPLSGPYNTFGAFQDSLTSAWSVELDSATAYVVGAACTAGCDSVALGVLEPAARVDSAGTGHPVLAFTTRRGGTYTIMLRGHCAGGVGARCRWVAQVYERGASGRLVPGYDAGKGRRT